MENRNKLIHRIIVVCFALVCIFIGHFEDAFVGAAFLLATVYNLVYIIFLRKITGESVLGSIANIILIWGCIINVLVVSYMIYIFFAGYTDYGLFGWGPGIEYHGVDAWLNNWLVIIAAPAVVINFIFMGIYAAVKRRREK